MNQTGVTLQPVNVLGIDGTKVFDCFRIAYGTGNRRSISNDKLESRSHGFEWQEDVRENNRGVDVEGI